MDAVSLVHATASITSALEAFSLGHSGRGAVWRLSRVSRTALIAPSLERVEAQANSSRGGSDWRESVRFRINSFDES
jgi:hypothetical protein